MSNHTQTRRNRTNARRAEHESYRRALKAARESRAVQRCPWGCLGLGVVVDARVEFDESRRDWKWRPVVILAVGQEQVTAVSCTSVRRSGPRQLSLEAWQEANLAQPTDVVLRPRTIPRTELGTIRGSLSDRDQSRLLAVLDVLQPDHRSLQVAIPATRSTKGN